ncbi:MAG: shikimate dehydrogenase [Candidatus Omnitrophica bacterium]|jgi:shikimate dehydrogenase|nr:shikimate dehydrogenase [Candidatus Omnitrophota bacterium]
MPKIYGVLGFPVKHSFSPAMHNAAFQKLQIDAEYKLFEKNPEELDNFIKTLADNNIHGLNITVPYKEKVIAYLTSLSPEAEFIGAVNTIKAEAGKLTGFNTDGEGFIRHLTSDMRFDPRNKKVAMLGCGGAAKAVSAYLAFAGIQSLAVYDLDSSRCETLLSRLRNKFPKIKFSCASSVEELNIKQAQLLVNATPVGMKQDDPCLVALEMIYPELYVYDLIYNPAQTKLLELARKKKAAALNGLGMLLYQGAKSFEIFTGKIAPIDVMRDALNNAIAKG